MALIFDLAFAAGESVPNRRALAIGIEGTFILKCGNSNPPEKIVPEILSGKGYSSCLHTQYL